MSDRGMKKWAPYKSLVEHDAILEKARSETKKVEKPLISNERAEEINDILVNYHGELLLVEYYRNYKVNRVESTIARIDPINKKLVLSVGISIKFNEFVNITRI